MDYILNVYGLLLICGIVAISIVVVLYRRQKRQSSRVGNVWTRETDAEAAERANNLVDLNADALKALLSPLRNDQPAFIHEVTNLLVRVKTQSNVKVLRAVLAELEVKNELLSKVDEVGENLHNLDRQKENFKQKDELQDLTHQRDKQQILNETEKLKNPPPPPPSPPPPKSQAERKAEDKRRKEAEAARHEAEVRTWRKDLSEDPSFDNEDMETEIERRKRDRGWLDSI